MSTVAGRNDAGSRVRARRGRDIDANHVRNSEVSYRAFSVTAKSRDFFTKDLRGGNMQKRIVSMFVFAAILLSLLGVRVALLQTLWASDYREASVAQRTRVTVIRAERGSILDRYGRELALPIPTRTVFADPRSVVDPVGVAHVVAGVLQLDAQAEVELATKLQNKSSSFVYIARQADKDVADAILALQLKGVSSYRESGRALSSASLPQELIYTINFQNTGTYYAYNIYVDDTLDSDLDFNSLRILSSSHYMYTTWPAPNVIRFNFDNIFLPDSSTDLAGSMGYIVYSIDPKPALPIGTQLTNSAAIYFDYNAPVITNSTLNTISSPTHIQLTPELKSSFDVYPNPAINDIIVLINNQGIYSLEIMNITGKIIRTISDLASGESYVNMKEFGSGIYLLRLVDQSNQTVGLKKIAVQ